MGIHSIEYNELTSYFYLFAVLDLKTNEWYSWDNVCAIAKEYNIPTVPLLFRGTFDSLQEIEKWMTKRMKEKSTVSSSVTPEGFVIRNVNEFAVEDMEKNMAKYVRHGHVQTEADWVRTWKTAKLKKK